MNSSILLNPGPWYQATPYINSRPQGAWDQMPFHSGINSGTHGPSFQRNFHPAVNTVHQNASTQMPFNSNVNVGPQGALYQVSPFGGLSGSAMYHPAPSSVAGPTNQGTLYQQPSPPVYVPTSPTRSSGSSWSERSAKSRKPQGEDRHNNILGTLTLQNIGMSESEMFSGDVSKFHRFLCRHEGLMSNLSDPQVKLNYLLM
jgi:hypothetical protein